MTRNKNELMNFYQDVHNLEITQSRSPSSSSKDKVTADKNLKHSNINESKARGKLSFPTEKSISFKQPASKSQLKILENQRNTSVQIGTSRGKPLRPSSGVVKNSNNRLSMKSNKSFIEPSKLDSISEKKAKFNSKFKKNNQFNHDKNFKEASLTSFLLSPGISNFVVNTFEEEKKTPFKNKDNISKAKLSQSSLSSVDSNSNDSQLSLVVRSKNSKRKQSQNQKKESELSRYKMPLTVLTKSKSIDSNSRSNSDKNKKKSKSSGRNLSYDGSNLNKDK